MHWQKPRHPAKVVAAEAVVVAHVLARAVHAHVLVLAEEDRSLYPQMGSWLRNED